MKQQHPTKVQEKALLIGLQRADVSDEDFEYSLAELVRLTETAGAKVQHCIIQRKHKPDPGTYLGQGKIAEIRALLTDEEEIGTVIFDNDLNPRQANNLTEALNRKVIDRTELILDIFALGAHTKEAQLEVECAQLEYLAPRLTHLWSHLSRLGGGIGTRGPGETQLEVDRRYIRKRVSLLKRKIKDVALQRKLHREGRKRKGCLTVAIVGYTNAGKSTLLKALSKKEIHTEDKLFATLDPVIRKVYLPDLQKEVLFSDTVGFIKNLPHHLVNSFKSTLEEAAYADLIIHVVDIAAEDFQRQIDTVYEVLQSLNASSQKILTVFNKSDLKPNSFVQELEAVYSPALIISALQKEGTAELLTKVAELLK